MQPLGPDGITTPRDKAILVHVSVQRKNDIAQIVTDLGFAPDGFTDNLVRDRSDSFNKPQTHQPTDMRCHFCSQCCDPLLRSDFLPPAQRHRRFAYTQHNTIP